jgi:hypothetical protein
MYAKTTSLPSAATVRSATTDPKGRRAKSRGVDRPTHLGFLARLRNRKTVVYWDVSGLMSWWESLHGPSTQDAPASVTIKVTVVEGSGREAFAPAPSIGHCGGGHYASRFSPTLIQLGAAH